MEGGAADLPADLRASPEADRPAARPAPEWRYAAALSELLELRRELAALHASRSWRLTAPLRLLHGRRRRPPEAEPAADAPPPVPPDAAGPIRVSVITPAAGGAEALLRRTPAGIGFEVHTAPAAPAGTPAARCNAAAARAAGEWLVIWDGASAPQPGWLSALVDSFSAFPRLGMAGAVLLDRGGRLAAAGATLGPDGALLPLGAGAAIADPEHGFAAAVDAIPVGAVMVPLVLWRRFGGLDPDIASLDHALAELGLRMRDAGLLVVRQPAARLTQQPSPAGDAWAAALGRWHVRRRRIAQDGALSVLAGGRAAAPPRVLFVDHFVPTPDRDSGSADLHALLRVFVSLGWEPTLLPASDLDRTGRYVDDLRQRGVRVATGGRWRDITGFLASEQRAFDLLVVSRASMAGGMLFAQLRRHSPFAPLVFNTVDLHFLRYERAALLERSAATLDESFRMQQREIGAIACAERTILLSDAEQRLIAQMLPQARTCVVPIMRDIPGRAAPFGPRRGVAFIGGFRHLPNVDAVINFVRQVWPKLSGRLDGKLTIVGADAPPDVRALAGPDVELRGPVDDLGSVLAGCRLTVAPLRYGAGAKGKVVSSLAAGVPCVASPIAAEGMGLTDGVNVRVAADADAFAASVLELHEQPELWQHLSEGGLALARRRFSIEAGRARIADLLRDLDLPLPLDAMPP